MRESGQRILGIDKRGPEAPCQMPRFKALQVVGRRESAKQIPLN